MKIKPCPFCGSSAEMKDERPRSKYSRVIEIECSVCPAKMGGIFPTKAVIIKKWNLRLPPRPKDYKL